MKAGRPSKNSPSTLTLNDLGSSKPKKIQFEISEELYTRVKVYSAKKGETITVIMTDLIAQHIPE